jgi:hypothetical protein
MVSKEQVQAICDGILPSFPVAESNPPRGPEHYFDSGPDVAIIRSEKYSLRISEECFDYEAWMIVGTLVSLLPARSCTWSEKHRPPARTGGRGTAAAGIGPSQRLGFRGAFVTGKDTAAGDAANTKNPDSTEVLPGQKLPESGRPDSNRRRPAWEAGILPLNYAREAGVTRAVNVTGQLAGVKRSRSGSDQPQSPALRAPATPPESSGDPARSPPAPPATRCPACPPASTDPGLRPGRTGGRTSPR